MKNKIFIRLLFTLIAIAVMMSTLSLFVYACHFNSSCPGYKKYSHDNNPTRHRIYCSECEEYEYEEHSNITILTGDSIEFHYRTCGICDGVFAEKHTGYIITDTHHTVDCDDCTETKSLPHNISSWITTSTTHKKVCTLCDYILELGNHSSSTWIITSIRHSKECDECGATFSSGVHSYGTSTSITTDTHTRFCSVCDYSKVDDHAISSWTITTMSHTGTCSVCNYTVFESHSFKNGACSKCGVSESTINSMIEQGIEQMTITAPTVTE